VRSTGCTEGFALEFVPAAIEHFCRQHKGIRFQLTVGNAVHVAQQIREGAVDLGLTFTMAPMPISRSSLPSARHHGGDATGP
jgi:DNA-binding transcriptional LysR family regulator